MLSDEEKGKMKSILSFKEGLNYIMEETDSIKGTNREPIVLTNDTQLRKFLVETGVPRGKLLKK